MPFPMVLIQKCDWNSTAYYDVAVQPRSPTTPWGLSTSTENLNLLKILEVFSIVLVIPVLNMVNNIKG